MNRRWNLVGAALCLSLAGIAGCNGNGKTDTPAEQGTVNAANHAGDAANNAANKTGDAANNAGAGIKDMAKDATAAMVVTPEVKSALTSDAKLNDKRNVINVDSKDNVVHLRGHVMTNELKTLAGQIAQKTLTEHKSTDKLSNELMVDKH